MATASAPSFTATFSRLVTLALHPKQDLATHGADLPEWATLAVKLIRYGLASVVGVAVSQAVLIFCSAVLGWSGVVSNLAAVTVGGVPNYFMNRAWTWDNHEEHSLWTDVVPFWGMAFAGLALSTVFVAYADHHWGTTFAISMASLLAFGLLWLVKFVVLDRLMFGRASAQPVEQLPDEAPLH
jgi:putative flippase GtrA